MKGFNSTVYIDRSLPTAWYHILFDDLQCNHLMRQVLGRLDGCFHHLRTSHGCDAHAL